MTIDERLAELMKAMPYTVVPATVFGQKLRLALLEVARDQRQASAEAIRAIDSNAWARDAAIRAVMDAEIE